MKDSQEKEGLKIPLTTSVERPRFSESQEIIDAERQSDETDPLPLYSSFTIPPTRGQWS